MERREWLKMAGVGVAAAVTPVGAQAMQAMNARTGGAEAPRRWLFDVRAFGAVGNGATLDTNAINAAIDAAAKAGGGTVVFPAGTYLSYSIHLKSKVGLFLDHGAVILAASTPYDGMATGGYDHAEPQGAWEPYQDYGHNHWHNSLLWGEGLEDISITGSGMIWGKGLSRGWDKEKTRPNSYAAGVGNKAIALKNCHNVLLKDFRILEGGWFGILATGVDNLTIDNLLIDTIRDGMDIDCCRNVRVSNCTVNSPYDDGICPKSSFALGYLKPTENVTIANCFVTGGYVVGTVMDGTWQKLDRGPRHRGTGRIKFGTESNGGFKNITITNCVFEDCQGFALETEDGARVEDVTVTGITMRGVGSAPLFLRLGVRMRGPKTLVPGVMKRVILSNITSSGASMLPSILSGVPGHMIEDVKISDVFLEQVGGGTAEMAALQPEEKEAGYPDPGMFGQLPASGLFARHVRNLEVTNLQVETVNPDARPAFWLRDIDGADFFRVRVPRAAPAFALHDVKGFRSFGSRDVADVPLGDAAEKEIPALG
ncbi:MAG TPA: glycoside hydrolase family 28 protein [Terracidiphilus sp.]|nr:glycoside hydrolase family 28 protein [Terracidiphilus sp.]